jgi:threonylcarbamoyladenosine tRNA methylthiotransferase MtaB
MKVSLLSLGCKVNQAEVSLMEGALRGRGIEVVGLDERPELCVINTCTVTVKSDYQSRQLIRRARRAGARVMVTGCYAELNRERVEGMEGVHGVVDNRNKMNIIQMITELRGSSPLGNGVAGPSAIPKGRSRARLFLKVQDGCDHSCSYCVIPMARGGSRSVRPVEVISEIKGALAEGYREVVLSGIHLGLYGNDLSPSSTLSSLVGEILLQTPLERLRLSSLEINEIDGRLMELFDDGRLMRHLHIPLQSGDDNVLSLMNRNYGGDFFRDAIWGISGRLGDIAMGTDVIAGFPGEGEREFEGTYRLLDELPFTYIHAFPFSPRPGTAASLMAGMAGDQTRKQRVTALKALSEKKKRAYMSAQLGRTLDILVEEELPGGICRGTSSNYLKVHMPSGGCERGSIVPVRVEEVAGDCLLGKPLT